MPQISVPPRQVHVWLPGLISVKGGIQAFCSGFVYTLARLAPWLNLALFVKNDEPGSCPQLRDPARCRGFGRWPAGKMRTLAFALQVLWAAARERPVLIIVAHANFTPLAVWLKRLFGAELWVLVYGIEVLDENGARLAADLRQADRLLSISRFTRDHLVQFHGQDAGRFRLLPVTFDENRFRPAPKSSALLSKLRVPTQRRIILTICRLAGVERYKGYDQILSALPAILRAVPQAHYVLGGQGDDAARLRRRVAEMGLEGNVTLAGFVPENELVDYYNLCDVFAMPSRREGFGIVYLEALACGKPVLAGDQDGAVDALCGGELGVLVDPEDSASLAAELIALLEGRHPHPLVYRPEELRRRVIEAYGQQRFAATLGQYLDEFLPPAVARPFA